MTPEQQLADLEQSIAQGTQVWAVHYSCESLYTARDHPPGVSAISFASIPLANESAFSRATFADQTSAEEQVLIRYHEFLANHHDARIVHWNMNKTEYGFSALAARYEWLKGSAAPQPHPQNRLLDLDDMIVARHGTDYVAHPHLANLVALNRISERYALSGEEQAQRFEAGDHGALNLCTAERSRVIARIALLLAAGQLQTERSGPSLRFAGTSIDSVDVVKSVGQRVLEAAQPLTKRRSGKTSFSLEDEYDFQDLTHALLRVFFDDVRPEEATPSAGGAASRIDFLVPAFGLAVELKASRASMSSKSLGEELIVDARRYAEHPDVRHLICLVFDRDMHLDNPKGIETDLSTMQEGIAVTVCIYR